MFKRTQILRSNQFDTVVSENSDSLVRLQVAEGVVLLGVFFYT
jgi:hypothetical protein